MTPSIKGLRKQRADKKAAMAAIATKETDDAPLGDDDVASFNALKDEVDRLEARIARLTAALADNAEDADPRDDDDAEKHWSDTTRHEPRVEGKGFNINTSDEVRIPRKKGEAAGRYLVGMWYVKQYGLSAAKDMARNKMGDDVVAKMLTTSQPVIPQDFNPDWIELLQTKAVVRPICTTYPMPVGNMTIPRQRLGSQGAWLAEGTEITVTQLGFDNIQLSWHKYGALTYTTRELLEFTPLNAAGIIANDLTSRLALLEDSTFLQNTNDDGGMPLGIPSQVAAGNVLYNSVASSNAVNFQTVAYDLEATELALTGNLVLPSEGGFTWLMPPGIPAFLKQLSSTYGVFPFKDEVSRGFLNGWPIRTTTQLASNLVDAVSYATTSASSSSTTLTLASTYGIQTGMVVSGTGISGTPTVSSITDGTHVVLSAAQTVASGATMTFTGQSTMSSIILVKGADLIIGDAFRFAISMTTEGSFVDGDTQVNTFGQDLVAFKATNAVDFQMKHNVSAAVLNATGWSLNNVAAFNFYEQSANTSPSTASSAQA